MAVMIEISLPLVESKLALFLILTARFNCLSVLCVSAPPRLGGISCLVT